MEIKGTIIEIFPGQQVSEKFKKREFVIQDNENPQYPQYIKFELAQDKCGLLDSKKVGDQVNVSFNLRGREYTNPKGVKSYFNSLQAWKIVTDGNAYQPIEEKAEIGSDGLPF
jgi:hypothetical protein